MAETVGRYVLHESIARGGMATVHAARLTGAEGFHRLVAAKRLHPELTEDPEFVTMFHDEAKIASRIHHPNVVPVLDVVVTETEVLLVQEYVHGVTLSVLMRRARQALKPIPVPIAVAIAVGILSGLHAAHEAKDDLGTPLDVVHRDVSPQNVMLSTEGVPRLLDFGIAKARTSSHQTRPGVVKGKLSYMAPEQIRNDPLTRRADVYAAGVVLWELLANRRIAEGLDDGDFLALLFEGGIPCLVEECSAWRRSMGQAGWKRLIALDAIVMKALSLVASERYATAQEMVDAIVAAHPPASQSEVAAWVSEAAGDQLAKMRASLAENEEEFRAVARQDAATLSRRATRDDSEAERKTIPMPEARLADVPRLDDVIEINIDVDDVGSNPPTSVSNFGRPDLSRELGLLDGPKRAHLLPWLGAAAICAAAFVLARGQVTLPTFSAAPAGVVLEAPRVVAPATTAATTASAEAPRVVAPATTAATTASAASADTPLLCTPVAKASPPRVSTASAIASPTPPAATPARRNPPILR